MARRLAGRSSATWSGGADLSGPRPTPTPPTSLLWVMSREGPSAPPRRPAARGVLGPRRRHHVLARAGTPKRAKSALLCASLRCPPGPSPRPSVRRAASAGGRPAAAWSGGQRRRAAFGRGEGRHAALRQPAHLGRVRADVGQHRLVADGQAILDAPATNSGIARRRSRPSSPARRSSGCPAARRWHRGTGPAAARPA